MVDITRIVEKGMREGDASNKPAPVQKPKTLLDDLFGEAQKTEKSKKEEVRFSKKLGDLFGVEEHQDGK